MSYSLGIPPGYEKKCKYCHYGWCHCEECSLSECPGFDNCYCTSKEEEAKQMEQKCENCQNFKAKEKSAFEKFFYGFSPLGQYSLNYYDMRAAWNAAIDEVFKVGIHAERPTLHCFDKKEKEIKGLKEK